MTRAGVLRRRALIERRVVSCDAAAWVSVGAFWVEIETYFGRDVLVDNVLRESRRTHVALFRAQAAYPVEVGMRMLIRGVGYLILEVGDLDGRGRWMRAYLAKETG